MNSDLEGILGVVPGFMASLMLRKDCEKMGKKRVKRNRLSERKISVMGG